MMAEARARFKVGMYGGSFDPLHLGHLHDIIRAASMCELLYVVLSWCEGRESTSKELRYRWLLNSTRHLSNVRLLMLEDDALSKELYNTDGYWEKGAQDIKRLIGRRIDAVFCGSDYLGTNRFESLYAPESEVIYFDRAEVPVCSTDIRAWALQYWDYIPAVCRPHYVRTVLIVGSESTGKSTLTQNLALAYNTDFVREIGRETCDYAGGEELMLAEDLYENFLRQKVEIMQRLKGANRLLFVDTDAVTTLFYSYFLLDEADKVSRCRRLAEAIADITHFDLIFFLEPTVDFVQDGTRSDVIAHDRETYSRQLKDLLSEFYGSRLHVISGDYLQRFNQAKCIIEQELHLTTQW